jgi:hypothetical protein
MAAPRSAVADKVPANFARANAGIANPDSEAIRDWLTFTQNEIESGGTSWLR